VVGVGAAGLGLGGQGGLGVGWGGVITNWVARLVGVRCATRRPSPARSADEPVGVGSPSTTIQAQHRHADREDGMLNLSWVRLVRTPFVRRGAAAGCNVATAAHAGRRGMGSSCRVIEHGRVSPIRS